MEGESEIQAKPLKDRPVEELIQLASDTLDGKVFGTWQLPPGDMVRLTPMLFIPLCLCDPNTIPDNVAQIYEYMDKAGPRSCNGYPVFFSGQLLSQNDWRKFVTIFNTLLKAREAAKEKLEQEMAGAK